jgi:hypothetical protein
MDGNSAGIGGNGGSYGALLHAPTAVYDPINTAISGAYASAGASQMNIAYFDQTATQIAGLGDHGGHLNLALGGELDLLDHSSIAHAL